MAVFDAARKIMVDSGNTNQWKNGYPSEEIVLSDIEKDGSYVIEDGGQIVGYFAFLPSPEPTYYKIYDGEWLDDDPYGTIHRIASDGTHRGIMKECVSFCESIIPNLRIDTHNDNKVMQHQIEKNGFTKCGTIYVEDGSPRIAYQKNNKQ